MPEYITSVMKPTSKTAWHIRRDEEPQCCCGKVEMEHLHITTLPIESKVKVAGACQKAFERGTRGKGRILDTIITVNLYCNYCNKTSEVEGTVEGRVEYGGGCHTCAYEYGVVDIGGKCPYCERYYETEYHGY